MAIFHLDAAVGSKAGGQSAAAKFDYVCREGKYGQAEARLIRREGEGELVHAESGNMPAWAKENPARYWQAADQHERANGRLFQQVEIALPRELSQPQQIALAVEFAKALAQTPEGSLPYTVAIHRGKGTNPHAHIVLSERAFDGHDRTAETWFKRVATSPRQKGETDEQYQERQARIDFSKGGARKSLAFQSPDWIDQVRQQWAERANLALTKQGREERIDHRSHSDRGLQELPTIHVGPRVRGVGKDDRVARNEEVRQCNAELIEIRAGISEAKKEMAQILRGMLTEIRTQLARVSGLKQLFKRQQREKQEAEAKAEKQLQEAIAVFRAHGNGTLIDNGRYRDKPMCATMDAKQAAGDVRLAPEQRAKLIQSGEVLRDHFAAIQRKELRVKHPNMPEAEIKIRALGMTPQHKPTRGRGGR